MPKFLKKKLVNALEKKTGMDLDKDGWVGGGPKGYPANPAYQQYGQPSGMAPQYAAPHAQQGQYAQQSQYTQPSMMPGQPLPPNVGMGGIAAPLGAQSGYSQGYNHAPPPTNPALNAVENATGLDLNGDGRIGDHPSAATHFRY
jgi:hypothetical protein